MSLPFILERMPVITFFWLKIKGLGRLGTVKKTNWNSCWLVQKGVTLIELMITIAVLAITLTLAIPAMQDFTIRNRLASINNDLMTVLIYAKSEAVKRGVTVSLCSSSTGTSCGGTWSDGWIVFVNLDGDNPAAVDGSGETILRTHEALPTDYAIDSESGVGDYVNFDRAGVANHGGTTGVNGSFVVCHDGDATTARGIQLTPLRARLASSSDLGSCSI